MQDEEDGKISTCEGNKRFYAYRLLCDGCQAAANLHDRISKTVAAAPSTRVHLAVLPPCRHATAPSYHPAQFSAQFLQGYAEKCETLFRLLFSLLFRSLFVPFSLLFRSFFRSFLRASSIPAFTSTTR
ncbi:hypothetical protein POVWA2_011640 [Plasmodium ovale wallikeri]|uniref:Uncharacterized protein n=1 Tax=Plasmodium ovale wallikeri TaxID=864142 RepID=A0A1A8YMS5_PLAOA|nr:hypothetical protein POVWA2_011640 [Plasmodium ovale wallikeri]